jgi:HNH endonuclease
MKTCACGCGTPVKPGRLFLNLHQNRGEHHPNFKGGERIVDGRVFILNRDHPRHNRRGYVRRSWLVMEQKLGRFLQPGEVVHHINKDTMDDAPENLELHSVYSHHSLHSKGNNNKSYRWDIDTANDILPLRQLGYSIAKIASILNCSTAMVRRRIKKHHTP